jgi:transposase
MKKIPCAIKIVLTVEERAALEALNRSSKSETRMRTRAQIVLLAACGMPAREIGRMAGCTKDTASKWRMRYARDRLAGLHETCRRGAEDLFE